MPRWPKACPNSKPMRRASCAHLRVPTTATAGPPLPCSNGTPRPNTTSGASESSCHPAGNSGASQLIAHTPESNVFRRMSSRSCNQSARLGSPRSPCSTAASNEPQRRKACRAFRGPHPGIPANTHHNSNRSTAQSRRSLITEGPPVCPRDRGPHIRPNVASCIHDAPLFAADVGAFRRFVQHCSNLQWQGDRRIRNGPARRIHHSQKRSRRHTRQRKPARRLVRVGPQRLGRTRRHDQLQLHRNGNPGTFGRSPRIRSGLCMELDARVYIRGP